MENTLKKPCKISEIPQEFRNKKYRYRHINFNSLKDSEKYRAMRKHLKVGLVQMLAQYDPVIFSLNTTRLDENEKQKILSMGYESVKEWGNIMKETALVTTIDLLTIAEYLDKDLVIEFRDKKHSDDH